MEVEQEIQQETEQEEAQIEEAQEEQAEEQQEEPTEEVTITIGDEAPQEEEARAPDWVRELRKANREKERRIRELESQINQSAPKVKLAQKPKLEDFDYDAEKFDAELDKWYEKKRIHDIEQEKIRQSEDNQVRDWQNKLDSYTKAKNELKVKDYDDAEFMAQELFNVTQQGVIIQGADNPALVVYALGKNPKKAQELSRISDPVKFAFAIAKLEKELKVVNKKTIPPPERTVQGTGRVSGSVDSTLDRLREEAARTGDLTKVMRYKAQLKKKSA
jgi:hypothetical protein